MCWKCLKSHELCTGTLETLGSSLRRKSGMKILTMIKMGKGIGQPTMVQQLEETGHLIFNGVGAFSRGVLKQKKGTMNTALLFQKGHSVHQLSVYGAHAIWCCHFVFFFFKKKKRINSTVDNKILTTFKPEEVQLLCSLSERATGNRMPESPELRRIDRSDTSYTVWKCFLPILSNQVKRTKFFQMRTTDGKKLHLLCREE